MLVGLAEGAPEVGRTVRGEALGIVVGRAEGTIDGLRDGD